MSLLAGLFLVTTASADTLPAGTVIDPAAVVDVTPDGLESVTLLIPSFLPSEIEIPDIADGSDNGFCLIDYGYGLSNGWVGLQVTDAQITPTDAGYLDVTVQLLVNVNNSADKFRIDYEAACISGDCDGYVTPFAVSIHTTVAMNIVPGPDGVPVLDATVGTVDLNYDDLTEDDIVLDCWIGTLNDILSVFGLSIYDLLLDQVDAYLQDAVTEFLPDIEATVEEAFSGASINQELDLNGVTATINLYPSAIDIQAAGMRVALAGSVTTASTAACIAPYDPGGSLSTPSSAPAIGTAPEASLEGFHAGLNLSDEFVNQALYGLWRGGLLCYTIDESLFAVDTSIMNSLTGNVFQPLFPESKPVILQTVPRGVPDVAYDGEHAIDLNLHDLDLEFWAELDGRMARITSVSLNGAVGADLAFDGGTGNLAVELAIDADNLTPTVSYNDLYPDQTADVEAAFASSFGGLLSTILDVALGDLTESLAFALPNFSGIGLQDLETAPAGANGDWLGAYAWLGGVTYGDPSAGCGGCGEDGGSGCDSGCATHGGVPKAIGLLPLLVAVALRRRR